MRMRYLLLVFASVCLIALAAAVTYAEARFLPANTGNVTMLSLCATAVQIASVTCVPLAAIAALTRLLKTLRRSPK